MRKLIISLSLLATILAAATSITTTTTVAYAQDFLFGGSPDVPVQIDPEHASPPLIESSSPSSTPPAAAQQQQAQYYTDEENGFRFKMPEGWVAEEPIVVSDEMLDLVQEMKRHRGTICPIESAQPTLEGGAGYDCIQSQTVADQSYTMRVEQYDFVDLEAGQRFIEEMNSLEGMVLDTEGTVMPPFVFTVDTLISITTAEARGPPGTEDTPVANTNVQIITHDQRTTNITDAETGEVITPDVQVAEISYTYRDYAAEANNLSTPDEIRTALLVAYQNPEDEDDIRAFKVSVGIPAEGETVQDSPPGEAIQRPAVRQVFDSFELIE